LEVAGPQGLLAETPTFESRHLDIELHGKYDAPTGSAAVTLALKDPAPLLAASLSTRLDLKALVDHPTRAWSTLRAGPVAGSVDIPRRAVRSFASLPSFVAENLPPLEGDVAVHAELAGTLAEPRVTARIDASGVALTEPTLPTRNGAHRHVSLAASTPKASPWALPVSLIVDAHYDAKTAVVNARIAHAGKEIARVDGDLALPWTKVLTGSVEPVGSVRGVLTDVPLGEVPFFSLRNVAGNLGGSFAWDGIGTKEPTVNADLSLSGVRAGKDVSLDQGSVHLVAARPSGPDRPSPLSARLDLTARDGGSLTATASTGLRFLNGITPVLDSGDGSDLDVKAHHFRLGVVSPLTSGDVSRVDGRLDGELHVGVARPGDGRQDKVRVAMKVSDGVLNLPAVGQEFHHASLALRGGDRGVIDIADLSAEGTRGRVTGAGHARFAGLRFVGGDLKLSIAEGAEIPVTVEGVPFGDARGEVVVTANERKDALELNIGIPTLHLDLPNSVGRGVQDLKDNPAITIVDEDGPVAQAHDKNTRRVLVSVVLGQIVVKARMLNVELGGVKNAPLRFDLGEMTKVTGDIRLARGKFVIAKKDFEIEHGIIHLRAEDPSNPSVILTARWDSPEGPIYMDYNGLLNPVTSEKLKLHSPSPALATQEQIMSMLLTGGLDPTAASSAGAQPLSGFSQAAGGVLLDQLGTEIGGGWSTTLKMSDASTVQTGLKYQTDNTAIGVTTYDSSGVTQNGAASGIPNGGISAASLASTDSTARGTHNVITLDWRMLKNWVLRGHVDVGSDTPSSGVDAIWQRRY
jgi:translocation and assembly module TamB